MNKIHDIGKGSGDVDVSNGYYAINPSGHIVLIPPAVELKAGFRLATQSDLDARKPQSQVPPMPAKPVVDKAEKAPAAKHDDHK